MDKQSFIFVLKQFISSQFCSGVGFLLCGNISTHKQNMYSFAWKNNFPDMSTIPYFIQITFDLVSFVYLTIFFPFSMVKFHNSKLLVFVHESCVCAYFSTDYNIKCSWTAFLVVSISIVCRYFSPSVCVYWFLVHEFGLLANLLWLVLVAAAMFSAFRISNRIYNKSTKHTSHIRVFAIHKFEKLLFLKTNAVELARMRRFIIIILLNSLFMSCRSLRMHALIHKMHNAI